MGQIVNIEDEKTQEQINGLVEKYKEDKTKLIGLLQDVMEEFGYLPEDVMRVICDKLDVPIGRIYELAMFYSNFRLNPIGENHVCVCVGTACHVRGAVNVVDTLERELHVKAGTTSDDLKYTLETVNCLGACALGPLVTVNGEYHGKMNQKKIKKMVKDFGEDS